MRTLLLVCAALILASCDHMYGAADVRFASDHGLTDAEAIAIARREAVRRRISLRDLKPSVARFDTGVSVVFDSADCKDRTCLDGGLPHFFIPAGTRRVSYVRDAY